jgi:hypothetical protein
LLKKGINSMGKMNRRSFVQSVAAVGAGLFAWAGGAQAQTKRQPKKDGAAAGSAEAMCAKEAMAVSINYAPNHKAVTDAKLKVEKQGVPFDKQFCNNCMFYSSQGKDKAGKDIGKCQLLQGCHVYGEGWSTSWAKKA